MIVSRGVCMVRHPRRSYQVLVHISIPIAVSGSGYTGGAEIKPFDAVIHMQENRHKVPISASLTVLSSFCC